MSTHNFKLSNGEDCKILYEVNKSYIDVVIIKEDIEIPFILYNPSQESTEGYFGSTRGYTYLVINIKGVKYSRIIHEHYREFFRYSVLDLEKLEKLTENIIFNDRKAFLFLGGINPRFRQRDLRSTDISVGQLNSLVSQSYKKSTGTPENLLKCLENIQLPKDKSIPINYLGIESGSTYLDVLVLETLIKNGYTINNIMFIDLLYNSIRQFENIPYSIAKKGVTQYFNSYSQMILKYRLKKRVKITGSVYFYNNFNEALIYSLKNRLKFNFCITIQPQGSSSVFKQFYDSVSESEYYINIWNNMDRYNKIVYIHKDDINNRISYTDKISEKSQEVLCERSDIHDILYE